MTLKLSHMLVGKVDRRLACASHAHQMHGSMYTVVLKDHGRWSVQQEVSTRTQVQQSTHSCATIDDRIGALRTVRGHRWHCHVCTQAGHARAPLVRCHRDFVPAIAAKRFPANAFAVNVCRARCLVATKWQKTRCTKLHIRMSADSGHPASCLRKTCLCDMSRQITHRNKMRAVRGLLTCASKRMAAGRTSACHCMPAETQPERVQSSAQRQDAATNSDWSAGPMPHSDVAGSCSCVPGSTNTSRKSLQATAAIIGCKPLSERAIRMPA